MKFKLVYFIKNVNEISSFEEEVLQRTVMIKPIDDHWK